jgi:hypothetical protein
MRHGWQLHAGPASYELVQGTLAPRHATRVVGLHPARLRRREFLCEAACSVMASHDADDSPWSCASCTFINAPLHLVCDVCWAPRRATSSRTPTPTTATAGASTGAAAAGISTIMMPRMGGAVATSGKRKRTSTSSAGSLTSFLLKGSSAKTARQEQQPPHHSTAPVPSPAGWSHYRRHHHRRHHHHRHHHHHHHHHHAPMPNIFWSRVHQHIASQSLTARAVLPPLKPASYNE